MVFNERQHLFRSSHVVHFGVTCAGCEINPIHGNRYKSHKAHIQLLVLKRLFEYYPLNIDIDICFVTIYRVQIILSYTVNYAKD